MAETLIETSKFTVERRQVRRPDGSERTHDLVIHPGAAVILPILDDGSWVMIRNWRPVAGRELLELPAGTLDPGESPETCARRELEEETGYRAERIEKLVEFFTSPGICTERMHGFVARGLVQTSQDLDAEEQIKIAIMSPDEALKRLRSGEIEDGKTIAMMGMYHLGRSGP